MKGGWETLKYFGLFIVSNLDFIEVHHRVNFLNFDR
jgi:hypothetical protein